MNSYSPLQRQRLSYQPKLPDLLYNLKLLKLTSLPYGQEGSLSPSINEVFPNSCALPDLTVIEGEGVEAPARRVAVLFSGGQASGGHNVIIGIYDALMALNPSSTLIGFLGGPRGLLKNQYITLDGAMLEPYRNQGGFDMIGSGRSRISSREELLAAEATIKALQLDGVVIIGGDDSNTNAAFLAEYLKGRGLTTTVVGVPKTIDGDLKNEAIETSFGFDTATKSYAELIGSIARDALSAKKYYHVIKLMGRSASHVVLECALQTHPNYVLIGEEVQARGLTLKAIISEIADMVCLRSQHGKDYGVILLPEGIIEFIPEVATLIEELNVLLAAKEPHSAHIATLEGEEVRTNYLMSKLTPSSAECLRHLPVIIQEQLLGDRDPHGNVQVSKIESERLIIGALAEELVSRKCAGRYQGKFSAQPHFCGYEGRSCFPSNFDCQYCYALGHVAALLINQGLSGYMCSITGLASPVERWRCGAVPLIQMMGLEEREGERRPVISKALVNLHGIPFQSLVHERSRWAVDDDYRYPGPIQFFGHPDVTEAVTMTLALEHQPPK